MTQNSTTGYNSAMEIMLMYEQTSKLTYIRILSYISTVYFRNYIITSSTYPRRLGENLRFS